MSGRSRLIAPTVSCAAAALLFVLAGWWWVLTIPLTGVDVWPLLAQASRAVHAPLEELGRPYLDGLWHGGRFWRPLTTAIVCVEWHAFDFHPLPYHAVRLLTLWLSATLAGEAAAARAPSSVVARLLGAALVVLHPVQVETLPVVARGADGFVALTLVATLWGLSGTAGPRVALGIVAALLAPWLKETGLLAPALGIVLLAPWNARDDRAPWRRALSALLAAGLAGHLLLRRLVLGGGGGYDPAEEPSTPFAAFVGLGRGLLDHEGLGVAWVAAVALAVGVVLASRRVSHEGARTLPHAWLAVRRGCVFWLVVQAAVICAAPRFRLRYAEGLLVPLSVLLAASLAGALAGARASGRERLRAVNLIVAALLVLVPGTPVLWRYPQWDLAGRTAREVLASSSRAALEASAGGGTAFDAAGRFRVVAEPVSGTGGTLLITIDPFPIKTYQPQGPLDGRVATAAILSPYAVEAFFVLEGRPRGSVRVVPGQFLLNVQPGDLLREDSQAARSGGL